MQFEKIGEEIFKVRNNGGYLIIKELVPSYPLIKMTCYDDLLNALIQSKYHFWQGENNPYGLDSSFERIEIDGTTTKTEYINYKLCGFYNNSKLKASHYKELDYKLFIKELFFALDKETSHDKDFIINARSYILKELKNSFKYYHLALNHQVDKELLAENFMIFDFFYAFISLNITENILYRIEFGLD